MLSTNLPLKVPIFSGSQLRGDQVAHEPIIAGMDKPNRVFNGVTLCGDCGKPLKVGAGGVSACKNPTCVRNKPVSNKPS
jgi:hypothetical protein